VQFADVCLQRARVYEVYRYPQSPGKGGWPTIRYFNAETGQAGKPYTQLHSDMSICTELGDVGRMLDYVKLASGAVPPSGKDAEREDHTDL